MKKVQQRFLYWTQLDKGCTNEEFLLMDEARLLTGFPETCTCDDPLLKEYARCIF